jgi:hypothetical protein
MWKKEKRRKKKVQWWRISIKTSKMSLLTMTLYGWTRILKMSTTLGNSQISMTRNAGINQMKFSKKITKRRRANLCKNFSIKKRKNQLNLNSKVNIYYISAISSSFSWTRVNHREKACKSKNWRIRSWNCEIQVRKSKIEDIET